MSKVLLIFGTITGSIGIFWALAGQNFVDTQAAFSTVLGAVWGATVLLVALAALVEI